MFFNRRHLEHIDYNPDPCPLKLKEAIWHVRQAHDYPAHASTTTGSGGKGDDLWEWAAVREDDDSTTEGAGAGNLWDLTYSEGAGNHGKTFAVGKSGDVKPYPLFEAEQTPLGQRFPVSVMSKKDDKLERRARKSPEGYSVSYGKPRPKGEKGHAKNDEEDDDEKDGEEKEDEEDGDDEL